MIEEAFREQWSRVLACLVGFPGDFDLAEEACQEAFAIAAERWPRDGAPANPLGWLVATARSRDRQSAANRGLRALSHPARIFVIQKVSLCRW
ncbi:MAG: hypothetical protein ACLP50_06330 [Solirubrobacteraceae bacterium]